MATPLANITAARDNVASLLAAMTANPKPSYTVDGQSISWGEYFGQLTEKMDTLNLLIQRMGGPYEIRSRGVT